jgi:hypothetical protein
MRRCFCAFLAASLTSGVMAGLPPDTPRWLRAPLAPKNPVIGSDVAGIVNSQQRNGKVQPATGVRHRKGARSPKYVCARRG